MKGQIFKTILVALPKVLTYKARRFPAFRERLKQRNLAVRIELQDGSIGRTLEFRDGSIRSRAHDRTRPDVRMSFKDVATALKFLMPNPDQGEIIHAAKNFKVVTEGPDELVVWFAQTMNMIQTIGLPMGTPMPDGSRRYTSCTNGGPVFVYVKDGRILRVTPIEMDGTDPAGWEIEARGRRFSPPHRALVAPHALTLKSLVYSDKRILYPDEARGLRSRRRAQSRRTAASRAMCASAGTRRWTSSPRKSTGRSACMGRARSPSPCRPITSGAMWATTSAR